ncbi:response regulator [Gloeobacter morelensis]|uniref:histidine kinase n=1 Tax=Gloeobacter morelensis MG652769 TaxID=2781736 RepID=A0ABY3PTJ5_9CYAN|nr:response regulator [Gloeobacter morelensis]UFP96804.1 CHASE3 domain-containing protein [Gloeobacter morelensis MG652769]
MIAKFKSQRKGSIARRLLLTLGSLLLVFLLVFGFNYWLVFNQVENLRQSYRLSRELNINVYRMQEGMTDQETGVRGFLLARQEEFLAPFYQGRVQYLRSLEEARRVVQLITVRIEDPQMRSQMLSALDAAGQAAESWYEFVRAGEVESLRRGDLALAAALDLGRSRQGKERFDRFRQAAAEVRRRNDLLFAQLEARIRERQNQSEILSIGLLAMAGLVAGAISLGLVRSLRRPFAALEGAAAALSEGNFQTRVPAEVIENDDELAVLARSFDQMAERLGRQNLELRERDILDSLRALDAVIVEERDLDRLCGRLLESLGELTGSQLGALYLLEGERLLLQSSLGLSAPAPAIRLGEGMVGLAASRGAPVVLQSPPAGEPLSLETPAGALQPRSLSAWPLLSKQQLVGVLFVAGLEPLAPMARNLLESVSNQLAIALLNSRSARAIEEARARLEATFEQMSDGVSIADAQGNPQLINPAGLRILGLPADQDLTDSDWQNRFEVFTLEGEPLEAQEVPVRRAVRFGTTVRADLQIRIRQGRSVLLSVSASPLKDGRGDIYGVVAVFRDVTVERERERRLAQQAHELEALNAELAATNAELEAQQGELEAINAELEQQRLQIESQNQELVEADRQKNNFLASMSHELRTPLNAIIGFSQLLLRNKNLQEQPQVLLQLDRVYQNGKIQLRLVNDILDLAKIKAGKVELRYQPVALEPFVREVYAALESLALQKNLSVRIAVDPSIGSVETDPQQLRTILINLLSNAFKYTERGEVEVRARRPAADRFELEVRDTGVGIDPDQQQKVFDEFSRLEGAATRQASGTGLGLAICKRLVTLMGGEISLVSTPGVGSTFTVRLPCGPAVIPAGRSAGEPPKVLFIEHDLQVQQLVATRLAERSYRLLFAPDSIEGIQIAKAERPDAIVLDPTLPRTDLWAVLFELRTDPTTAGIPILLQSIAGERGLAIPLGLADFLTRPVGQESLLAVLKRRRVAPEGDAILIVDDSADNREYLAACLRDEGYRVQPAASGPEALTYLESHRPQLVILDLMMPQMDGFEVLRRLRRMPGGRQLPVLILSAMDLTEQQRQSLLAEQTAQILKKGDQSIDELLSLLDDTLRRQLETA